MNRNLTAEEKERYFRQIILDEVGEEGQKKLFNSRVLVVGAGGLGSPVSYYLTAAGVGNIGLVDSDRVELSNLQRQILHFTPDLGRAKIESARDKLVALNPHVNIKTYGIRVTEENVAKLIADYDLVIAAVDNLTTRYLLNKACFEQQKPLIEGGVRDFAGQVTTFLPPDGPCYQCLFPKEDGIETETPKIPPGLFGVLPGVIGSLQANEALKILLGIGKPLNGKLLIYDSLSSEFNLVKLNKIPGCPICQ